MLLTMILFAASALCWPLRRLARADGLLFPFLAVALCSAGILAGLLSGLSPGSLWAGPALCAAAALLPRGREGAE